MAEISNIVTENGEPVIEAVQGRENLAKQPHGHKQENDKRKPEGHSRECHDDVSVEQGHQGPKQDEKCSHQEGEPKYGCGQLDRAKCHWTVLV